MIRNVVCVLFFVAIGVCRAELPPRDEDAAIAKFTKRCSVGAKGTSSQLLVRNGTEWRDTTGSAIAPSQFDASVTVWRGTNWLIVWSVPRLHPQRHDRVFLCFAPDGQLLSRSQSRSPGQFTTIPAYTKMSDLPFLGLLRGETR